jgi:hypothetical protein
MTPFMERVTEVVTGGERGGWPETRPSKPRPVTGLPDWEPVTGWDPVRYAFGDTA